MDEKPTYDELERRIRELEEQLFPQAANVYPVVGKNQSDADLAPPGLAPDESDLQTENRGRVESQQVVRQSDDRFRNIFRTSPDAVCLVRQKDQAYVEVNESFTSFTDYSRVDLIGKSSSQVNIWWDLQARENLAHRLQSDGSVMNMEAQFIDKQGGVKTGSISAMLMTFQGTKHMLWVIRDADLLIKTREALVVSESRFRELFNNMSSGAAIFQCKDGGEDFIFVDFNRAAEKIEKVSRKDLLGGSVLETFASIKKVGLFEVFQRVWKTGKPEHYSVSVYKDNVLKVWKENYVYQLPSKEIIVVYDDITDRKQAEESLLSYQKQLKSLTSELSLAEERERRSIATHLHDQIGQTLSVIKIKLHGMREESQSEEMAIQLDQVSELLQQTIQFTRSLTFELSPPVLYELGLEPALEWLSEKVLIPQGIVCRFENDGLKKPLAEDVQVVLFRSVRELFTNIVKYAEAKTVRVSIRKEQDSIRLTVRDDGKGFDLAQIDNRVNRNPGFGLFNIRERLGHLGGYFMIDSQVEVGTVATLVAPLL